MKFYTALAMAAIVFSVSACKKNVTVNVPSVYGKWDKTKTETTIAKSVAPGRDSTISDSTNTSFTSADFIQFNSDGTGIASATDTSASAYKSNINFAVSSNILTLTRYTKVGDTTVVIPYTIGALSSSHLILQLKKTYQGTDSANYTKTQTLYYSK